MFHYEYTTPIQRLLLLWRLKGGGGGTPTTLRGVSPLTLANAIKGKLKSLVQFGKVSVSGGTITCNNGVLTIVDDELPLGYKRITGMRFDGDTWYDTGEVLTGDDDVTMTLANTTTTGQNVFGSYNGTGSGTKNFSLYLYGGGSTSNCYFRYGSQLVRPRFGSDERTITFGKSGTSGFTTDVSVTPDEFTTEATAYIGMLPNSTSPTYTGSIIGNILVGTRLKYIPCERTADGVVGYYETHTETFLEPSGTGSVTKGEYDTSHETVIATVGTPESVLIWTQTIQDIPNLYSVNDIADEYDFVSGKIIRRTEAVVQNGAIVINALAEPVEEQGAAHSIALIEGSNEVSWHSEVDGKEMEATYLEFKPKLKVGEEISDIWTNENEETVTAPWVVVHSQKNGDSVLQWKYGLVAADDTSAMFDEAEAVYYFDGTEEAGDYYITIGETYSGWVLGNNIQITLNRKPAKDDQLVINCGYSGKTNPANNRTWYVYSKGGTVALETGNTTSGNSGVCLGTIYLVPNGRLNGIRRSVSGYGNWAQSAMRQFFNSEGENWWSPQNPWDRPPRNYSHFPVGFMTGISDTLRSLIKLTKVETMIPDGQGSFEDELEITYDYFFLPSLTNVYLAGSSNFGVWTREGSPWSFYVEEAVKLGVDRFICWSAEGWQDYEVFREQTIYGEQGSCMFRTTTTAKAHTNVHMSYPEDSGSVANLGSSSTRNPRIACTIRKVDGYAEVGNALVDSAKIL